jgi:hypothetical protein
MANVKLASYLTEVSGRLGNYVYYSSYGREYVRVYVIPENPDTDAQKIVRKTFGDAVRSWQSLPDEEHQKFNKKARRLNLSGYNLYISTFIKDRLSHWELKKSSDAIPIAVRRHSDITQTGDISVSSPFCLYNNTFTPYIQSFPGSIAV